MEQLLNQLRPIAKALVGATVAAVSPVIVNYVQTQGEGLIVVVVGAITAFLGGLAVWAKPNKDPV